MNKMGKRFLAVALAAVLMLPASLSTVTVKAEETAKHIQILHTSDLHGKFVPFKYATYEEDKSGSLAQIATVIKDRKDDNTILIDVGDTIQDNSADLFLDEETHPMIKGLNALGYDYWVVGNHEFNFGIPTLKKVMEQFEGKVLCGNVYDTDKTTKLGTTYDIIERDGVKVAIIGAVTPNITKWDGENLKDYKVTNPIDEIRPAITAVKAAGAQVIVLAFHGDVTSEYGVVGSGCEDLATAFKDDVDLILGGHGHQKYVGEKDGVLIVENLSGGQTISDIDITVDGENVDVSCEQVVISKKLADGSREIVDADDEISTLLEPYNEKAKADAQTPIGKLEGGDLVRKQEIPSITQAQIEESAMMNLINDVQLYYANKNSTTAKATVSAAAVFSADANILEGDIKKCDASLIYKYDNTIYKYKMTGKQLKQYMEWSVSYYNTYKKGDLTISFNPDVRSYLYDIFAGVTYDINISKEAGSRIENLKRLDGSKIKDTDEIIIAVNNYRGSSQLESEGAVYSSAKGDTFPVRIEKDCYDGGYVRDLIAKYIKEVKGGTITPEYRGTWKITGNNWNEELHDRVVALAAAGLIEIPTSEDGRTPNVKSVTENDIKDFAAKKTFRVKFEGNGGVTNGDSICSVDGTKYGNIAVAIRSGYAFDGWYTRAKDGKKVSTANIKKLSKSTTLYAHWTKLKGAKATVKSLKSVGNSIQVVIDKVTGASSYKVTYSTDKNFKKNVKTITVKGTTAYIAKPSAGKKYYVKVTTSAKDSLGKTYTLKAGTAKSITYNPTAPAKTAITELVAGKKAFTVSFKAVAGAKGYIVYYSTDKNFKSGVKQVVTSKTSLKVSKLTKGKTYYVKVAAYAKDAKGKKLVGKQTAAKKIKVK